MDMYCYTYKNGELNMMIKNVKETDKNYMVVEPRDSFIKGPSIRLSKNDVDLVFERDYYGLYLYTLTRDDAHALDKFIRYYDNFLIPNQRHHIRSAQEKLVSLENSRKEALSLLVHTTVYDKAEGTDA